MNSPDLKITRNVRPAGHGLAWLMQSVALIRAQPARLLFITVLLQLILGLSQVPVIGILVILAVPGFSAGLLDAFRRIETGQPIPASILFVPLTVRPANGRFLMLGVVMFIVAALAAMMIMGGSQAQLDPELIQRIEKGDTEAILQLDPELIYRVVMAAMLAVAISGTLSFLAIPLIWFRGMATAGALLEGLRGLQANWKPFLVLGLGLFAFMVPVVVLFIIMASLASSIGLISLLFAVLLMLTGLLLQLLMMGAQYCAFKDIYGLEDAGPAEGGNDPEENSGNEGDDDQFLA